MKGRQLEFQRKSCVPTNWVPSAACRLYSSTYARDSRQQPIHLIDSERALALLDYLFEFEWMCYGIALFSTP